MEQTSNGSTFVALRLSLEILLKMNIGQRKMTLNSPQSTTTFNKQYKE